jgi:sulfonate transport system substrate-binding protein
VSTQIRRRVLALLAVSVATLGLVSCTSGEAGGSGAGTAFRVAYLPTANYLTTVKDSGFLEQELAKVGGSVSWVGPLDPLVAYDTVTAGKADASSTGTGYFVNLAAHSDEWVAFALEKYTGDSQGIVARPGSGINSLQDLYGKKVGIDAPGATGDYLLTLAFDHAGLDVSKVQKVTLDTTTFATAFASGQVDAIASYDQNFAAAQAVPGAKTLITGADMPSYNWSIHIASRQFAEQHPQELKAAYDGLVREAARAKADPRVITGKYKQFGATDDIIAQVRNFSIPTIEPLDAAAVGDLQKLADQYVKFGFLDKAPDIGKSVVDEK